MNSVRFRNAFGHTVVLVIEPWASEVEILSGSNATIHYPPRIGRLDTSFAELMDGQITFWCEGETFEVDIDGVRILT